MGRLDRIKNSRLVRRVLRKKAAPSLEGTVEPHPDAPSADDPRNFFERSAKKVVGSLYKTHADDLEDRASRVVSRAYESQADDLEDRAVRALRRAVADESERIQAVIEHAVNVKKREVRLSLLVLIAAALVYLVLEAFARNGA
ncbi:MAG: hypothetical protein WD226_08030 [Planctomycetota bacterium]